MLGAAGVVEAAITALTIQRGVITPGINIEDPDPGCGLHYVTSALQRDVGTALSNSFGFGGVNAVLVLKRFKDEKQERIVRPCRRTAHIYVSFLLFLSSCIFSSAFERTSSTETGSSGL